MEKEKERELLEKYVNIITIEREGAQYTITAETEGYVTAEFSMKEDEDVMGEILNRIKRLYHIAKYAELKKEEYTYAMLNDEAHELYVLASLLYRVKKGSKYSDSRPNTRTDSDARD